MCNRKISIQYIKQSTLSGSENFNNPGMKSICQFFPFCPNYEFPFKYIKVIEDEITGFVKGHPADSRTIFKRFRAELLHNEHNHMSAKDPYFSELKFKKFNKNNIELIDSNYFSYFTNLNKKKYFLISGSFLLKDSYWGIILIDTDGNLLRTWKYKKENYDAKGQHIGLAVSKNGDILTNTHGVLRSVDWCNKLNWLADWKPLKEKRKAKKLLGQ